MKNQEVKFNASLILWLVLHEQTTATKTKGS